MTKVFTRRFRVRYSEIGVHQRVSAENYLRYVVETAYDWGAANQLGMNESEEIGLAWVIRETELEILSPLVFDDEFDISIWLMEWRKVRGIRGFKLERVSNGELVAQGAQKVVSLDVESMRPIPPPDRFMDNFRIDEPPKVNLKELKRILKPEGELLMEELSKETFQNSIYKRLFKHPYEQMFSREEFENYLKKLEFKIRSVNYHNLFFLKYFVLIAKK